MKNVYIAGCVVAGAVILGMGSMAWAQTPVVSGFDVSLYGYVKLDASYDTQQTQAGNLMFYVRPEGANGNQEEFNMTARETRFGLNLVVPAIKDTRITGRVETDFYGPGGSENSPNLRLRLAYVDMARGNWALRAGQDWETFITLLPRTINFATMADAGALGLRRPQLRITHVMPMGDKAKLVTKLAAARTIGDDIDGGGQNDGAASGHPSLQGNVAFEMPWIGGRPLVLGLSGHVGTETVAEYTTGAGTDAAVVVPEADYDSWSVIGTLGMPISKTMTLQGTLWSGENLATYYGGIGQGVNKVLNKAIAAQGGWGQLLVNVSPTVNVNLGYGVDEPDAGDLSDGNRSKNELLFANLYYNLNKAVTLVSEYSYMTTSYQGGADAENNRVQCSMIFKF